MLRAKAAGEGKSKAQQAAEARKATGKSSKSEVKVITENQ